VDSHGVKPNYHSLPNVYARREGIGDRRPQLAVDSKRIKETFSVELFLRFFCAKILNGVFDVQNEVGGTNDIVPNPHKVGANGGFECRLVAARAEMEGQAVAIFLTP